MKFFVFALLVAVFFAAAARAADPATLNSQLLWEDVPPTSTVEQVVQRYSTPGLSTNDVCNVVTNVVELDEWTFSGDVTPGVTYTVNLTGYWYDEDTGEAYEEPGEGRYWDGEITLHGSDGTFGGPEFEWPDATSHTFDMYRDEGGEMVDAGRITATRKHVMRNALGLARLEDLPSTNGLVNADGVRDIVTNVTVTPAGDWVVDEDRTSWDGDITVSESPSWNGSNWVAEIYDGDMYRTFTAAGGFDALELNFVVNGWGGAYADIWYTRHPGSVRNTLGLARLEDVPDTSGIASSVNTMWSTLYGESVWLAVTNYLRQIAGTVPSLRLWEVRDGGTNMVYSSAEEIEHVTTQRVDAAERRLAAMMPRTAWGSYQSTGADNPSSNTVTIINSPKIMLTGGGEWYRTIETGGGSVWVLKTGGLMTGGGDTNGYFRVVDAEGNAQIEIVKTADQIVDAVASDVDFDAAGNFTVTFNASGSSHPIVSCAGDLGDVFYEEDASGEINTLGITVAWEKNSANLWTATLHQDERAPHLFVYGKVLMQGSNLVRNAAPTSLDGGLYINNVRYRLVPYTTGGKTYLTLEAW